MTKPKIFISHSQKDASFATQLVSHLNMMGVQAWMDSNDLGAGNFQQRISEALNDCEWFLLVLTRNALASKWVRQEVDAANLLKHRGQIRELIFIKAADVDYREVPALWGTYNVFDAMENYGATLQRILKELGIRPPLEAIATELFSLSLPSGTRTEPTKPVLRLLDGCMHESDAEQLRLAEADLAEAQRLAEQLTERLQSFSIHALNANELANHIDIPDSLEMAVDLAQLVRDYVTQPYAELCRCGAPLMEQRCLICDERMCTGDGTYGLAPVSFGRDCGRTAVAWQVKDEEGSYVEVCSRHTYEEVSAYGLDYCEFDDTF